MYRSRLDTVYRQLTQGNLTTVHAGLWLDRYMGKNEETEARRKLVEQVASIQPSAVYRAFYRRWETMLQQEMHVKFGEATVRGRMAVDLGAEGVLETSVALHHTYGVPYIPGSALKGLAASYAHQRLGPVWQRGSEAHKALFGDTTSAGFITFFDALYIPDTGHNGRALYPDVITVHHQRYYHGDGPPTDRDQPIPVPFLSATGTYLVALSAPDLDEPDDWLTQTFTILQHALRDFGIGAKTSSGYGRMELKEKTRSNG